MTLDLRLNLPAIVRVASTLLASLGLAACARGRAPDEPPAITHHYADVNGVRLHYAEAGRGRVIILLHGFPEFWGAWSAQIADLSRDHRVVAVDMRGYNLSSKPESVSAYTVPTIVEDIRALGDHLGAKTFVLVGHDWGGLIAWSVALGHPDRVEKLVIVNAPHPAIFARELANNPAQQKASAYMQRWRQPGAEQQLSANDFAGFAAGIIGDGVARGRFTREDSIAYREAWRRPGALTGGLNYYRAMVLGGPPAPAERDRWTVRVPTLVIWGERDPFLLTGNLDGLDAYVPSLRVVRVPDASHWVVHEKGALVNATIREFVDAR